MNFEDRTVICLGVTYIECRCCNEELPMTSKYFGKTECRGKVYINRTCKLCERENKLIRRHKNGRSENKKKYDTFYIKNRIKNDPSFKISYSLRCRIKSALKSKGTIKSQKTKDLLGCNFEYFKKHIESKFKPGMNWSNYGVSKKGFRTWQVDHIIPCSAFDLTDINQQKQCFNYRNLQPLWWWENLKKSNKIGKEYGNHSREN